MRLLLLSNSTNAGQGYLEHARPWLSGFLGDDVQRVLFVPFAGVTVSYDDYADKVRKTFAALGYELDSIHDAPYPVAAVSAAEAIAIGGGNTFRLLEQLAAQGLLEPIRERVLAGMPFTGWSAGSNVAGPSICTTNDMPIVEPPSFDALGLVPFQINPHYTDAHPPGHQGETRADRLAEFVELNRDAVVAAMPEGTALRIESGQVEWLGSKALRIFRYGEEPQDLPLDADLGWLLRT